MAYTTPGATREKVFVFVRDRLLAGAPPTVREVQDAMGFGSVESARKHLDKLVTLGRLEKTPGLSRSYRLPNTVAGVTSRVPILGRIRAGDLATAVQDPEGFVVFESRVPPEDLFALRVRGDSMIEAGILPDDLLIVRRQDKAEAGEIVVALVGDEATVKTFRMRRGKPVLEPANANYEPIRPDPEELRILGRVIEVRRSL